MLFSPYLIHGCSDNANSNITRFSLEIRFIKDNKESKEQEENFNQFLKIRNWR
jgi:ectoine hydroxylase-related dioxygenase (phytanoyl-CoA dioxygenase family)